MTTTQQISTQLIQFYAEENWTGVNFKNTLSGITWQHAVTKVYDFNTIAALVFHINFYVVAILQVLEGEEITANDKFSFDVPDIHSEREWSQLLDKTYRDGQRLAGLISYLPEEQLKSIFTDNRHGTYYRNIHGVIEHAYYHLGQIVLIKKILLHDEGQSRP